MPTGASVEIDELDNDTVDQEDSLTREGLPQRILIETASPEDKIKTLIIPTFPEEQGTPENHTHSHTDVSEYLGHPTPL